jgi:hypothetical protein
LHTPVFGRIWVFQKHYVIQHSPQYYRRSRIEMRCGQDVANSIATIAADFKILLRAKTTKPGWLARLSLRGTESVNLVSIRLIQNVKVSK